MSCEVPFSCSVLISKGPLLKASRKHPKQAFFHKPFYVCRSNAKVHLGAAKCRRKHCSPGYMADFPLQVVGHVGMLLMSLTHFEQELKRTRSGFPLDKCDGGKKYTHIVSLRGKQFSYGMRPRHRTLIGRAIFPWMRMKLQKCFSGSTRMLRWIITKKHV